MSSRALHASWRRRGDSHAQGHRSVATGAIRQARIDSSGAMHRVQADGGVVEIEWKELAPRRIAGIALPALLVSFRFIGLDAMARDGFLA